MAVGTTLKFYFISVLHILQARDTMFFKSKQSIELTIILS
jgi:hypothetical protein